MNPQEVKKAVAGLSDEELAQLASRANKAQADFAAGSIGDRDLLIILVCIAAAHPHHRRGPLRLLHAAQTHSAPWSDRNCSQCAPPHLAAGCGEPLA